MAHLYTGRDGFMTFNNVPVAKVTAYTIQSDLELLDATSLRDSIKRYVPGLQSFSGSATVLYYLGSNGSTEIDGAALMRRLLKSGSSGVSPAETVQLSLRFEDRDSQGLKFIEINAWLTSVSLGVSVGEVASAQISFTARDEITVTL